MILQKARDQFALVPLCNLSPSGTELEAIMVEAWTRLPTPLARVHAVRRVGPIT